MNKNTATSYIGSNVSVTIDRPLGTPHPQWGYLYPINYGYIPNTISGDGEPIDAYILGVYTPLDQYYGTVVAVIHRNDDNDDKLVAVPCNTTITDERIRETTFFQEQYYNSVIIRSKPRCPWNNLTNSDIYMDYHDNEWGVASHDDHHLFQMLVLESFHCGLSWLCVLKKREAFALAFDNFDATMIANYDNAKIEQLLNNKGIIRNRRKILATIANAKAYLNVVQEWGSFATYIWHFTDNQVLYLPDTGHTTNALSDQVALDLRQRGFAFMGSVTTYSYLEAIGVMNNHSKNCYKYTASNQHH